MKFLFYIFSAIFILGCSRKPNKLDLNNISKMSWVYSSGYKIGKGDFIDFETNGYYELKKDSVFKEKKFVGRIVSYNSKYREITIKTPVNGISKY